MGVLVSFKSGNWTGFSRRKTDTVHEGKRITKLARALGMHVLISGRKDARETSAKEENGIEGRVPFLDLLERCTVVFVAVPLLDSTRNLISTCELEKMSQNAILVNVSRGGVVDEGAVVTALKKGRIAGAATDVFEEEPADPGTSPLLRENTGSLNLIVTPHLAWLAQMTWENQSRMLKHIVEEWCSGHPINVVA